ncbi:uncharacterized protein LOC135370372 [Ornithodoros turicata]|uniref:uncharacterized protein LOC135370372 n=1 Tax=Ornithodoros turicata TaxID=34597 RepID=UPI00313953F0
MNRRFRQTSYGRSSSEIIHSARCWMQNETHLFWPEPGHWSRECLKDSIRTSLHEEEMVGLKCEWERKAQKKYEKNQLRMERQRQAEEKAKELELRRQRLKDVLEQERESLEQKMKALLISTRGNH